MLKQRLAEILLSEPCDFVTACGSGPFRGTVVDEDPVRILVSLGAPISYQGHNFCSVVCQLLKSSPSFASKDVAIGATFLASRPLRFLEIAAPTESEYVLGRARIS